MALCPIAGFTLRTLRGPCVACCGCLGRLLVALVRGLALWGLPVSIGIGTHATIHAALIGSSPGVATHRDPLVVFGSRAIFSSTRRKANAVWPPILGWG